MIFDDFCWFLMIFVDWKIIKNHRESTIISKNRQEWMKKCKLLFKTTKFIYILQKATRIIEFSKNSTKPWKNQPEPTRNKNQQETKINRNSKTKRTKTQRSRKHSKLNKTMWNTKQTSIENQIRKKTRLLFWEKPAYQSQAVVK